MKRLLLVAVVALTSASVARADNVSIYSDVSGAECNIPSAGFNSTAAVVHKFSTGATYSRWKLVLPPGSNFFGFTTCNAYPSIGVATSDISVAYGTCMTGAWCVGTILAGLTPGEIRVEAADGQPTLLYTDCDFNEKVASGGSACVALGCCVIAATEQLTWGGVKALYH